MLAILRWVIQGTLVTLISLPHAFKCTGSHAALRSVEKDVGWCVEVSSTSARPSFGHIYNSLAAIR